MILKIVLLILFAYLFGSIPFGYLLTRLFYKKDIRTVGSFNIGATNVYRSVGKTAGIITLLLDMLKGYFIVMLGIYFVPNILLFHIIIGIIVILGHSYSIFLNFAGGKSVATTLGVFCALSFPAMFITLVVFIATLGLFGYISLASIVGVLSLPIIMYSLKYDFLLIWVSLLLALFIVYRHKENIKRLINKTENKFIKN